jgi:DNA-binding NarL/FixJ family response regulator
MMATQLIHVRLVDDHTMVRQGLRSVLESYPNIKSLDRQATGKLPANGGNSQPTLVLMDINLPKMDGIAATRFIKTNYPHIAVIGFSMTVHSL